MLSKRKINAIVKRLEAGVTAVGVPGHKWGVPMADVERHCREIAEERERLAAMVVEPVVLVGKVCPDCEEDKPATPRFWHRRRSSHDGLDYRCKACKKKYDRSRIE